MAFLGAALFVARRRSGRVICRRRAADDERQRMLHKLLALVDRQAIRRGYRRQAEETLHAFADRIRRTALVTRDPGHESRDPGHDLGLADWYLHYAGLRYGRVIDPAHVERLQRLTHQIVP
jgi:hypothetical protein